MTKLYHIARAGKVWVCALANGKWHWLYPKGNVGDCIR